MSTRTPQRAPAVFVVGHPTAPDGETLQFRLPYPPTSAVGLRAAHALERRAKKGYFAALDALRTGVVDTTRRAQLARLAIEARARDAHDTLAHLVSVMDAVSRLAHPRPMLPIPEKPLSKLEVTIQRGPLARTTPPRGVPQYTPDKNAAVACLEWPLEWLRTRGYILTQGLEISVAPEKA